ncbi:MAG: RNA-directed DNA polymerase [Nitrospirota bacterium]
MANWYSEENLMQAWKYAKFDMRDDFVFDVIDYEDIKTNLDHVILSLHNQIKTDQYHPAPPLRVSVPKNYHSTRPGTVIPLVDLIVLYAIAQQLAPLLDKCLSESAYAYRLNPQAGKKGEHLFKHRNEPQSDNQILDDSDADDEVDFPYAWFSSWKQFHVQSKQASEQFQYAAVTDITAYFENISLDLLREILKEKLESEQREFIDRLFRLLEFWDWTPTGNFPQNIGLVQGNNVSSFLSNLYLIDLDQAMLYIVSGDSSKYYRYVDDIKLFTSDKDEARRSLVKLESVLRTLNLNVQSAKTKIKPANEIYNLEVEFWLEKMDKDNPDKIEHAIEFYETVFDKDKLDKWQRPYSRCLTIFREINDDRAVDIAIDLFLDDPSSNLLTKNFMYLRHFVVSCKYGQAIANRLGDSAFTFPYHQAFMYRLAAYSRDDDREIKHLALQESINVQAHWFCRMAALFCLGTFSLTGQELAQIATLLKTESNPQVIRTTFVTLCQYSGDELRWVLDRLTLFNAPYQDYLRRYFFQLSNDTDCREEAIVKHQGRKFISTHLYSKFT